MSKLEANQSKKFPSQPTNPREETKAITLRSGKEMEFPKKDTTSDSSKKYKVEEETEIQSSQKVNSISPITTSVKHFAPPFSSKLKRRKKDVQEKEFLKFFERWK